MAEYGREETGERRPGGEPRSRSMFGSGWNGLGPDPREGRGWSDERDERGGRAELGERSEAEERGRGRGADRDGVGRREEAPQGPVRDPAARRRDFGHDDRHSGLPIEETSRLIASNKVEGTPVYSRDRHRLGTIYNFMVDKVSGQVEYAVMRYGGFMGMAKRYYPLPWRVLTFHRDAGGYVIDMEARDFESAPSFDRHDEPEFDQSYGRRVHNWYGLDY